MRADKRKIFFLTLANVFFVIGVGLLYWNVKNAERMPAAVASFDQQDMSIDPISTTLLARANIDFLDDIYELRFPAMGQACEEYNRYSLEFTTPNVRVSGEIPLLVIEGDCKRQGDASLLVVLPYKLIMEETPGDIDFNVQEPQSLNIKVRDVIGFWPEYWVLTRVKLHNTQTQKLLVIDEKQVSKITNNRLSMRWK
tara:strand:- start:9425 stop:10015 length:591 start_codon:yes stop_codon:yes gene_type:complete